MNKQHAMLFRFLDKHAPGWGLALRPENAFYQHICDEYDLECEEEFQYLPEIIRTYQWRARPQDEAYYHPKFPATPVIYMTAEQGVVVKLFWKKGEVSRYEFTDLLVARSEQ
jgi:hypothetical protein